MRWTNEMLTKMQRKLIRPHQLLKVWKNFNQVPGGRVAFSKLLGSVIPYTGSVRPVVVLLEKGSAAVEMADHRAVRNHLNSIHALALANLGEFPAGLSLHTAIPQNARAILTRLEVEYLKKARGTLISKAQVENTIEHLEAPTSVVMESRIQDSSGELVALVKTTWLVSPTNEGLPKA
jgi:acyl-coenzyme A thioesterase PaaI-like protein